MPLRRIIVLPACPRRGCWIRVCFVLPPFAPTDQSGSVPDNAKHTEAGFPCAVTVVRHLGTDSLRRQNSWKNMSEIEFLQSALGSILLHMRHAQSTVGLNLWTSCIIFGPGVPAGD